ncbi:uncharacterized protein LOC102721288 isoform X1 [Oryza brachyantha]|uniref:uncharacterized protein LOC102721288 isoform X1 n=2 Tax=Oryza brachyantha TaxID=4533 RepID=UPI001ADA5484|nr:uncharacterized protein LOC102721288 isoform X1 [Oryza brachyantha]
MIVATRNSFRKGVILDHTFNKDSLTCTPRCTRVAPIYFLLIQLRRFGFTFFDSGLWRESRRLLKMGEIISSAVVHETVNKIISGMIEKYERKSSAEEQMERLEMAQIKLEIALETSSKWQITSRPLQRWQKKLKRAAEECDDTLRKCRQRVQEEEEEQQVRTSSFPRRIADATKSLISSIFPGNFDEQTKSAVRRFEWFADGASDFMRSVEFGGTPRRYLFFDPLIGHLLAGETLEYKLVQGNKKHFFWIRPNNIAERRVEAKLIFICNDGSAPENNFFLGMMLQLSESTNIVGTIIKCLQLFTPYFQSTTETVRKDLTQLPTQDFSWMPRSCSFRWDNIHSVATEWFRPNPLCCRHHDQKVCSSGYMDKLEFPDVNLEPVIEVYLESQVYQYGCNNQRGDVPGKICSLRRPSQLKLGVFLLPHVSSTDLLPATENFVIEMIDGEEQQLSCHTNIALNQLNEIMLPKAIDSINQNGEVAAHQLLWKSKHEAAFFNVWNTRMNTSSILSTAGKETLLQQHDLQLESRADVISEFLTLWVERTPVMMQFSAVDWIQALLGGPGDSKKMLMSV